MNSGKSEDNLDSNSLDNIDLQGDLGVFPRIKLEVDRSPSDLVKSVGQVILSLASTNGKWVRLFAKFMAYPYLAFIAYQKETVQTRTTSDVAREVLQNVQVSELSPEQQPFSETSEKSTPNVPVTEETSQPSPLPIQEPSYAQLDENRSQVFLIQMKEETERRNKSLAAQMIVLTGQKKIVFWVLNVTGVITVIIAIIGAILLFNNQAALGIVSEGVSLLPGVGTVILFRLSKGLTTQVHDLNNRSEENFRALQSINTVLLIPDPVKRSEAIISLSIRLLEGKSSL
jgi:hypothetical protein